jgi:hypothetical protein
MRTIMIAVVLCLSTVTLFGAEKLVPFNVKTGQWEVTGSMVTKGALTLPPEVLAQMTPEQRATVEAMVQKDQSGGARSHSFTDKDCVTEEDLTTDPFKHKMDPRAKCVEHVIRSTGSDFEVRQTCTSEEGLDSDLHITFHAVDSEHVTGKGEVTANMGGHTIHTEVETKSKWLGACPAKKE